MYSDVPLFALICFNQILLLGVISLPMQMWPKFPIGWFVPFSPKKTYYLTSFSAAKIIIGYLYTDYFYSSYNLCSITDFYIYSGLV